jgi:ABC-type transport system involved in multi-copper enzyme maturation permease subunit
MAVKSGFSWPGFFFTWIWAFVSRLWFIGAVLLAVYLGLAGIAFGAFKGDALVCAILSLACQLVVGIKGNTWRSKSLESRDYQYLCTAPANSPAAAMAKLQQVTGAIPPEWRTRLPFTALSWAPASVRQLFAMAWLTLKAAFRYRLVQILIVLLLGAVMGLPAIIKHDGTARGFTQILLTYTLGTITTLLGFATLWLACGTLARDVEECQMQMVAVKPIARWEIWLGKWTGIMFLNLLLLALAGGAVYFLMQWRAGQLSPETQQQLRNEVLVSRGSLRLAVDTAAIERKVERSLQERLKDSKVAAMDRDFVRKQIREQVKSEFQIVPPGNALRWVISTGIITEQLRDQPLQLRIKFFTAQSNPSGTTYFGVWEIGPPNGRRYHLEQPSLAAETFHEFPLPPNLLDENGDLYIGFANLNSTALLFPLDEGIEVLYPESGFGLNFIRGLAIIACWLSLLAAIGLASASFLSFPVAAFVSLGVLIIGLSSGTVRQVVEEGGIAAINHETGRVDNPTFIDLVALPIFKGLLKVINLVHGFSPIDSLSTGRSVSWGELARAVAQIVLLMGGVFAAIGIMSFTRRELATAQGQQ